MLKSAASGLATFGTFETVPSNGEVGWFAGLPVLPGGRMLVLVKRSSPPEAMTALPLVAQGAEVYRRP